MYWKLAILIKRVKRWITLHCELFVTSCYIFCSFIDGGDAPNEEGSSAADSGNTGGSSTDNNSSATDSGDNGGTSTEENSSATETGGNRTKC